MAIPNPYASAGVVLPTTSTTTCVPTYLSITLNKGNSFVLPPGATLVAVSDRTKVTSDCVDVNGLEQFGCYKFTVSGACSDTPGGSTITENWEANNTNITAFYISGVRYPTTSVDLAFNNTNIDCPNDTDLTTNFETALTETSLSGLIELTSVDADIAKCNCAGLGNNNRGWTVDIFFKTTPSIANALFMELTTTPLGQSTTGNTTVLTKPISVNCPTTTTSTTTRP